MPNWVKIVETFVSAVWTFVTTTPEGEALLTELETLLGIIPPPPPPPVGSAQTTEQAAPTVVYANVREAK